MDKIELVIREVLTDDNNPEMFYTLGTEGNVWYYYANSDELDIKLNTLLSTYVVSVDERKIYKPFKPTK